MSGRACLAPFLRLPEECSWVVLRLTPPRGGARPRCGQMLPSRRWAGYSGDSNRSPCMSGVASEESLLGKVIADAYHLVEIRGRGAFGTVFKAHQYFCSQFVRPVAVKVTRQTGLTPCTAAALFGDAVMLAQIQAGGPRAGKEHLVPIHAMGLLPQEQGRGYVVMEYVDGAPLVAHIRTAGQIDIALGLRYIKELCRGLGVLHA